MRGSGDIGLAFYKSQSVADFALARRMRRGTIAFNCWGVNGRASGSPLAAAVMALSSCKVGITMGAGLDVLGMAFYLWAIGAAQAADSSCVATIHIEATNRHFRTALTSSNANS